MDKIKKYETVIKAQAGVLYLEGAPGTGKTAIAETIAKQNGWAYEQFILSQMDSADVAGIPAKDNIEVNGTRTTVTKRTVPEWAIRANERPTLVNFDELNRAPIECRNAALQILNERRVGNFDLNDNVYFISTGNIGEDGERSDGTEVEEMDSALWGRLIYMPHDLYYKEWKELYANNNVWNEVLSYLDKSPEHFMKIFKDSRMNATPRSWTNFSKFIERTADNYDEKVVLAKEFAKHYIGPQIASAFNTFLEEKQLININRVIDDWGDVKDTVKNFDRSRHSRLLHELEKKDLAKLTLAQAENLCNFFDCLHPDERMGAIVQNIFNRGSFDVGNFNATTQNIISSGDYEKIKRSKRIKKEEKVIAYVLTRYIQDAFTYFDSLEGENND